MNVWKSWAESKGLNGDIVKYEAKELDECLSGFFGKIRKSNGSDNELIKRYLMRYREFLGFHYKQIIA